MVITKERLHTLDVLRGGCMVLVMLYHLLFDLRMFTPLPLPWMFEMPMEVFRDSFVAVLILLSGFSCTLTKSNVKRGLKTLGLGLCITVGTVFFMPSMQILFGILHFMGTMMLIVGIGMPLLEKTPPWFGGVLPFLFVGFRYFSHISFPTWIREIPFGFILGIQKEGFYSADYYALLPWGFLFVAGTLYGLSCKEQGYPTWMYGLKSPVLQWMGQHSLILYFIHQPIFWLLAMGLNWIIY